MDYRCALFFQIFNGYRFSAEDLVRLLDPNLNAFDLPSVCAALRGHPLYDLRDRWLKEGEDRLAHGEKQGIRWSYRGQKDYPSGWNSLSGVAPLIFSYRGDPAWMDFEMFAVVGSRSPMRDTLRWMQSELPKVLQTRPGFGIVSGGARGVDQWAHRICIDLGRPTVCVYPSGLNRPYPPSIEPLAERILATGGALLSTLLPEESMRRYHFAVRNRWITGMSRVTFVAEANRRSGSSLTAKLAQEESREVCTLPVFPFSEQGLANLDLISENRAAMVRDARDLLQVLDVNATFKSTRL
jgi:DNA processing protein